MADLGSIKRLVPGEHGLATVSLVLPNGTAHASVVNAGVMNHPIDGDEVIGFVVRGDSYKLRRIRADRNVTISFRVSWDWAAVIGQADIIGPNDPVDGFEPSGVPRLLRDVFTAAGGDHDDWDEYDRVMADEQRTAIFVRPNRYLGR